MTQEQQLNKLFAQQMLTLDNSRTFRIDSLLNPTSTERKTQKLHPFGCNCSDALSFSSTTSFLNEPDDNNGTSAMLEMYIGLLKEHLLQRDHVVREDTVATIASLPSFLQNLCGLLPQLFQLLNLQQVFGSMSLISRPGVVISPNQLRAIQLVLLLMCTEYHCIHEVLLGTRLLSTVLEIVFMVPEEQLCSIVCQIIRRLLHHSHCQRIMQYLLEECHLIELILDSQTLNNSFMNHLITVAASIANATETNALLRNYLHNNLAWKNFVKTKLQPQPQHLPTK